MSDRRLVAPLRKIVGISALIFASRIVDASDRGECKDAIDKYNQAISDLPYDIKRYSNCVAGSKGKDDCSTEFHRVKNDQDDFEEAVEHIRDYCNDD